MSTLEHETIVNANRAESLVSIYTSDPRIIRRIRKDNRYTITQEHTLDGVTIALDVTIPSDQFHPLTGLKRRSKPLTEEQRVKLAERLQRARNASESL